MIEIKGGKYEDIMVLLQQDCPQCAHTWYEDLKRHKANGTWLTNAMCPACGYSNFNDKKAKGFDPSIIHAYNLDCQKYTVGEQDE